MSESWQPTIGLEIHAQLKTQSKMFSADSSAFGGSDNEHVSPTTLGLPGALPVLNVKAVEYAIRIGAALNCDIRPRSVFARKNYFYPDMPKGYQISQYSEPICENGSLQFFIEDELREVALTRAHLEEDAGKSTHHGSYSLINLNRAGSPLLEIVSEPVIESAIEAACYARGMRDLLRYLEVCDGNMEEGSLRCDCNVSVRKVGATQLGTKVELKNINSFKFVEKAIDYEILRQIDLLESGGQVVQETRLYDSTKNMTFSMRKKEEAQDYRYFPEPDLLPLRIDPQWVETVKAALPELPLPKMNRFISEFGLSRKDALFLTQEKELSKFFEDCVAVCKEPKAAANWIMGELFRFLGEDDIGITESKVSSKDLAELIAMVEKQVISGKIAKQVFSLMWQTGKTPEKIVEEKGLKQITDTALIEKAISEILSLHPAQVQEYRSGKTKVRGFFVGLIMKKTKGQASPDLVNKLLTEKLEE